MKKQEQKNNTVYKTEACRKECTLIINTVRIHMNPGCVQHMAGTVQEAVNSTILNGCAGARADRCQRGQQMQSNSLHMSRQ